VNDIASAAYAWYIIIIMNSCLNVCGILYTVYSIYYFQYGITLLEGLGLEDTPTLCLKLTLAA